MTNSPPRLLRSSLRKIEDGAHRPGPVLFDQHYVCVVIMRSDEVFVVYQHRRSACDLNRRLQRITCKRQGSTWPVSRRWHEKSRIGPAFQVGMGGLDAKEGSWFHEYGVTIGAGPTVAGTCFYVFGNILPS